MFNVVLVHPQIPQNTGSIGRICVNADASLHIIKPISFDLSQKALRRAGMDYWKYLDLRVWESLEDFLNFYADKIDRFYFCTTKTDKPYFKADFQKGDFLFFGAESSGLPAELMQKNPDNKITIPMGEKGRSLNLSVAVGIVLYDAIRQNSF